MKKIIIFAAVFFCGILTFAQTYTSAQNGNWMNPLTWSPIGVPIPGNTIIINHTVTLDTSFVVPSGSITVNTSGSLLQDAAGRDIMVNGGTFTNNGVVDLRYLLLSSGNFSNAGVFNISSFANYINMNNTGTIQNVDSLYNDGTLNNNGIIKVKTFYNNQTLNNYSQLVGWTNKIDSLYNAGTMLNDANAVLKADSATNAGTFTNNGRVYYNYFTNSGVFTNANFLTSFDMTNTGTYDNTDTLLITNSLWNTEKIYNTGFINISNDVLNDDNVNYDASFVNYGFVNVADSWYNMDTVRSNYGSWVVQDTSYNSGFMIGGFDFCDQTPPASSPYVDFNFGTIDNNITYCIATNLNLIHANETIYLYPNPSTGKIFTSSNKNYRIEVFNNLGQLIVEKQNTKSIDFSNYEKGIYLVKIWDDNHHLILSDKIIIE